MAWGSNIAALPGVPEVSLYGGNREFFAKEGEETRKRAYSKDVADARASVAGKSTGNLAELKAKLAKARQELQALESEKAGVSMFPAPAEAPVPVPEEVPVPTPNFQNTAQTPAPVNQPGAEAEVPVLGNRASMPLPDFQAPMTQQAAPVAQQPNMAGYPGPQGEAEAQMFGYNPGQPAQPDYGSFAKKILSGAPNYNEMPVFGRRRF